MVKYFTPRYDKLDLFPWCLLPDCADHSKGKHSHMLPLQQTIMDSTSKYLYAQGGVGSGKSVAFAAKVVDLCLQIPENRIVVSRLHYDNLFDSIGKKVNSCWQKLADMNIIKEPKGVKKVQGEYTEYKFIESGSILKYVQGKDASRALGADHGGYLVDDAMESLEAFFIGDETSAGLLSRLRLQEAMFNPLTYHRTERPHGSLHGMVSSNPPPVGHWLHRLFGNKPGIHKLGEDTIEWLELDLSDNPFSGTNYAGGLVAVQRKMSGANAEANIARIVRGKSIPSYGGVRVFAEFNRGKHVARLRYNKVLPLVTGWDFGYLHPAIVYSNLFKCRFGTNHLVTLSEVAECTSINVYDLYKEHEKHLKERYSDACIVMHSGDVAGFKSSPSNRNSRGDGQVLQVEMSIPFRKKYLDLANSLQYIRGLLKATCECGLQQILISHDCPVLIGALEGGYHYSKNRLTGKISEKPVEDRYFADVACAWRYCAENFVKYGVDWREQKAQRYVNAQFKRGRNQGSLYEMLEMSDEAMAQLLT